MSWRQSSSHGPQLAQTYCSWKTGQQVTPEVQLVRIRLHQLKYGWSGLMWFHHHQQGICSCEGTLTFTFLWWLKIIQATCTCIAHHFPGFCTKTNRFTLIFHEYCTHNFKAFAHRVRCSSCSSIMLRLASARGWS